MFLEGPSCSADRASGADSGHEEINFSFGIFPYFFSGRALVHRGISWIVELPQDDRSGNAVLKFFCAADGARHPFIARREFQSGTECFQQAPAFLTHCLRHGKDDLVAFGDADPGKANSGVAAGWFNDGGAGFQNVFVFCIFYHRKGDTVFDASTGIEIFQFNKYVGLQAIDVLYPKEGSVTDEFGE